LENYFGILDVREKIPSALMVYLESDLIIATQIHEVE
jgi:hypothetical protein